MNQFVVSPNNKTSIIENNTESTLPVVDSNEVKGGRFIVQSKSIRNQIPKEKRSLGMKTYVLEDKLEYILINNPNTDTTDNSDWEIGAAGKLSPGVNINNVFFDGTSDITINNVEHASTADSLTATGDNLGKQLWNWFHRYPVNYVPTDTSNQGWNALGYAFITYNTPNILPNQPSQYGQLINIPYDLNQESTQIWVEQNSGNLYVRGGNSAKAIHNTVFSRVAIFNSAGHLQFPNGTEFWIG